MNQVAVTHLDALVEKGLAASFGLIALLGGAILGFGSFSPRDRVESLAAAAALFFLVYSALSGAFVKLKIVELLANQVSHLLASARIIVPLEFQIYSLVVALGCISVMISRRAFTSASSKKD